MRRSAVSFAHRAPRSPSELGLRRLGSSPGARLRSGTLGARVLAMGSLLSGVLVLAGTVGVESGCADEAPAPAAPEPVVIGVSFGLSGALEAFTAPLRNAIRVAEGQINAAGGVLGRPVVFDVQDDQSDEDTGIVDRVATDFVKKGVVAVIGPIGSQQVVKTQAIYADARILQISPAATSTDLTDLQPIENRWLFRTTPADDFQGAAVLLFAKRTPRGLVDGGTAAPVVDAGADGGAADSGVRATCKKLAIVNVDNAYGNAMGDVIERYFPDKASILRKRVPAVLAPDYQAEATAVLDWKPECLALITYDDVGGQFVRDFKTVNASAYAALENAGFFFIGTDGVFTDGFLKRGRMNASDPTSANVAEGVYGTNPDTQPGTPEYNQFKTIYASYFPLNAVADAPAFAANTYDAALLVALAIQQAGTTENREAIRDALLAIASPPGKSYTPSQLGEAFQAIQQKQDIDYKGASGSVDLEPNGNVKSGFIVWQAYRKPDKTMDYRTVSRFGLDELLGVLK